MKYALRILFIPLLVTLLSACAVTPEIERIKELRAGEEYLRPYYDLFGQYAKIHERYLTQSDLLVLKQRLDKILLEKRPVSVESFEFSGELHPFIVFVRHIHTKYPERFVCVKVNLVLNKVGPSIDTAAVTNNSLLCKDIPENTWKELWRFFRYDEPFFRKTPIWRKM